jgi:hypothetical protein
MTPARSAVVQINPSASANMKFRFMDFEVFLPRHPAREIAAAEEFDASD